MSQSNLARIESPTHFTEQEYLQFERQAVEKHELIDGEIIQMAGASRRHNLISGNVFARLHLQLRGKSCETYIGDMRVRLKSDRYGYPDVVVVCGEPQFADEEFDTLLNPTVVVEVLSPSTRFRDKTEKLETFQKMESVRECLLIEQHELRVEHYIKQTPKQWLLRFYTEPDETISLDSIGCKISISEIYAQVVFDDNETNINN